MERKWNKVTVISFLFFYSFSAHAELEGFDDRTWADIGNEFSVDKNELSQKRSYSDINDSEGLLSLGAFVRLSQDVNLRESPGGPKIKPVLKDSVYQVLGVHTKKNGRRYYKIKDANDVGYFYAGTKEDYNKWAKQVWSNKDETKVVALPGDSIKVKRRSGMTVFKTPEFKDELTHISKNRKLKVKDIIEGQNGEVIYFVKYRDKKGYVKAGNARQIVLNGSWNELN